MKSKSLTAIRCNRRGSSFVRSQGPESLSGCNGQGIQVREDPEGVYYATSTGAITTGSNNRCIVGDHEAWSWTPARHPRPRGRSGYQAHHGQASELRRQHALPLRPHRRQPGVCRARRHHRPRVREVRDREARRPAPRTVSDLAAHQRSEPDRHAQETNRRRAGRGAQGHAAAAARHGRSGLGGAQGDQADAAEQDLLEEEDGQSRSPQSRSCSFSDAATRTATPSFTCRRKASSAPAT